MTKYLYNTYSSDELKTEMTNLLEGYNYNKTKTDELYRNLTGLLEQAKKKAEADVKDRERRKKNVNDFNRMAGRSSYRHH